MASITFRWNIRGLEEIPVHSEKSAVQDQAPVESDSQAISDLEWYFQEHPNVLVIPTCNDAIVKLEQIVSECERRFGHPRNP